VIFKAGSEPRFEGFNRLGMHNYPFFRAATSHIRRPPQSNTAGSDGLKRRRVAHRRIAPLGVERLLRPVVERPSIPDRRIAIVNLCN
jgi:hypothetical protein